MMDFFTLRLRNTGVGGAVVSVGSEDGPAKVKLALRTGGASNGFCDGRKNGASEKRRTGEGVTLVGGGGKNMHCADSGQGGRVERKYVCGVNKGRKYTRNSTHTRKRC